MDRRGLVNLVLLAAVAALGALIWHDARRPADADEVKAFPGIAAATRLTVLERDAASGELAAPRWTIEKRGERWWIVAPFVAAADQHAVGDLLGQLAATAQRASYPVAELDPKAVGLDRPANAFVYASDAGEQRHDLGGVEPLNYRRYVRGGATVQLVDDFLFYRLLQPAATLAGRKLLPPDAEISGLVLPGRRLDRATDGAWRLTPDDAAVSADAIAALIANWTSAEAVAVTALGPEAGLAHARIEVALAAGGAPLAFEVLAADDGLRLARRDLGLVYELRNEARGALLELPRAAAPR